MSRYLCPCCNEYIEEQDMLEHYANHGIKHTSLEAMERSFASVGFLFKLEEQTSQDAS